MNHNNFIFVCYNFKGMGMCNLRDMELYCIDYTIIGMEKKRNFKKESYKE